MFIFRFDLTRFKKADLLIIPEAAVYFGENRGHTYGNTIAVDEYGYIYVHGRSTSDVFRGSSGSNSWIHLKTHWDMTHEIQHNKVQEIYVEQGPGFLSKRFIRPKKFQNQHGPIFVELLYDSTCPTSGSPCKLGYTLLNLRMKGFPVNERMYSVQSPGQETGSNFYSHTLSPLSDISNN